jgi:hypothetical protein
MMRNTERARALGLSAPPRSKRPEGRPERRAEKRHLALLRVALLHAEGTRELCVVKNLSASGLSVRLYRELEPGTPVQIEFRSSELLSGSVIWRQDWDVGILFPEPIDVATVLGSRWITESGKRRNLPRIEISCDGRLGRRSESQQVALMDISQGGARVRTERLLDPGSAILDLPGLPAIPGVVRWATEAMAGISFNECLSFEVLARWIQARRGEAGAISGRTVPPPARASRKASAAHT